MIACLRRMLGPCAVLVSLVASSCRSDGAPEVGDDRGPATVSAGGAPSNDAAASDDAARDAVPSKAPIASAYRCFDLPGTVRSRLVLLPDGKRVAWQEQRFDGGVALWDFVALDLASGRTEVLVQDAQRATFVGDELVFLRATDRTGPSYQWKQRVFIRGVPVSPEGDDVIALEVDPASQTVYFSTFAYDHDATDPSQRTRTAGWKVRPGEGAPQKVLDGVTITTTIDGGKTLLVSVTRDGVTSLARLPVGATEPVVIAPGAASIGVVGDQLVYLPHREDHADPTLEIVPLAGGEPRALPGARLASRLLIGGDQVLVIDRTEGDPNRVISRTDGVAPLVPIAHLVGVDVDSAVLLGDGATLAAIVVHDTHVDGDFDYQDEADVCLVPASPRPFTPPTRHVAKSLEVAWPGLEALAAGDLAGAKPRFESNDGQSTIVFEVDGPGPVDLDALFARIRELAASVVAATKDPKVGVVASWKANARLAAVLWNPERGAMEARAGAFSMVLNERAAFPLTANPKVTATEDFSQPLPIATVCSGSLTNTGPAPIDVEVECRGWAYDEKMPDDAPSTTKRVTVRAVPAGGTAKYKVDLGRSRLGFNKTSPAFFVAGIEVSWFNEYAWNEVADFVTTSDRVLAATGYVATERTGGAQTFTLRAHHFSPTLSAPDFATLPEARQREIAKLAWEEYAGHYKRTHGSDRIYEVKLDDGRFMGRAIRGGKLVERH